MDCVNFVAGLTLLVVVCHRVAVIVHACGILIMATCVTFRIMNFQKQSTTLLVVVCHRVAVIVHACGILIMATCVTFRIMNFQKQSTSLSCSDPIYTTIELNINHFKLF